MVWWARYQSDIARTLLDGVEVWFLRGPIERTVGPAPFQVLVLLVGAQNDSITTFFSAGFGFLVEWNLRNTGGKKPWRSVALSDTSFRFVSWEKLYDVTLSPIHARQASTRPVP